MLDRAIQSAIQPLLTRAARQLVAVGIGADAVTVTGFVVGMAAAVAIAFEAYGLGLALLLASRLMDGLDGAVARATQPTDRGGFQHRGHGLQLIVGGEDRAGDQAPQVGALIQKGRHLVEIRLDAGNGAALGGKIIEGRRIAQGDT